MNTDQKLNVWLKAGLAANAFYFILTTVPLLPLFLPYGYEDTAFILFLHQLHFTFMANDAVLLPLITRLLFSFSPTVYISSVLVLFICLIVSIRGANHIAGGRTAKGIRMFLIGSAAFLPIGIIGMIGAWKLKTMPPQAPHDLDRNAQKRSGPAPETITFTGKKAGPFGLGIDLVMLFLFGSFLVGLAIWLIYRDGGMLGPEYLPSALLRNGSIVWLLGGLFFVLLTFAVYRLYMPAKVTVSQKGIKKRSTGLGSGFFFAWNEISVVSLLNGALILVSRNRRIAAIKPDEVTGFDALVEAIDRKFPIDRTGEKIPDISVIPVEEESMAKFKARNKKCFWSAVIILPTCLFCLSLIPFMSFNIRRSGHILGDGTARFIQLTADKGYVVAGDMLVKLNSARKVELAMDWEGKVSTLPTSMEPVADGGYIVAGDSVHEGKDFFLRLKKLDPTGKPVWEKKYPGFPGTVFTDQAGDTIMASVVNSNMIKLYKIDAAGGTSEEHLVRLLSPPGQISPDSVKSTSDGGAVISGDGYNVKGIELTQYDDDRGILLSGYDSYRRIRPQDVLSRKMLIRIDKHGKCLWSNFYGPGVLRAVVQTRQGDFIAAGNDGEHVTLIKVSGTGKTLWDRTLDTGSVDALLLTPEGDIVLAGFLEQDPGKEERFRKDAVLIKTDTNGTVLWQNHYGGTEDDVALSVRQTPDGDYVLAGWTVSYGRLYLTYYLMNIDTYLENLIREGTMITSGTSPAMYFIKTDAAGNRM
jgi:hypothetical protein